MEGQDRRHHAALFGARVRELSAVDAWHRDRRHRAVSTWRRAGGPGFDLRYLRQLRMALHRLLGRWTWRLPNRADVQTICQDRGSIRSRACINRLRSSQSDTAAGLVPEPVAIFWRVSLELPARLQD